MPVVNDLELAIAAARAGGSIVAEGFGNIATTDFKRRNDPVTDVDRASETAIVEMLSRHRPDDGLIGEEGTDARAGSERTWIVDPLDGTVNFVHSIPMISVSIGLYQGSQPLLGVVYDPLNDELFAATTGQGATRNGSPIHVSTVTDPAHAVVVTGFPYDHHAHPDAYVAPLRDMLTTVNGIRRFGSAALDFCWIACGRMDAGWEFDLKPWDIAGGLAILREAGGTATTPSGEPLDPWQPHVVTSNGHLHEAVRSIIARNTPQHFA